MMRRLKSVLMITLLALLMLFLVACQKTASVTNVMVDQDGKLIVFLSDGTRHIAKMEEDACCHAYLNEYACSDRVCIIPGCQHVERATAQHEYTKEYVCAGCGQVTECTLEILGRTYSEGILAQSKKNAGTLTGNFEIVVLGAEETAQHLDLEFLKTSPMDVDKITGGLFVRFDAELFGEPLETVYYNYGLQFSEEQTSDVAFTYDGSEEIWFLEVVEGNKTILFEYSVA